jgi:hypothetical protein
MFIWICTLLAFQNKRSPAENKNTKCFRNPALCSTSQTTGLLPRSKSVRRETAPRQHHQYDDHF